MKVQFTKSFEKDYRKLPKIIQKRADKQLSRLLEYPIYPSLRVKKMAGHGKIWEGRISKQWRFTFEIIGDTYVVRRAGTHAVLKNP